MHELITTDSAVADVLLGLLKFDIDLTFVLDRSQDAQVIFADKKVVFTIVASPVQCIAATTRRHTRQTCSRCLCRSRPIRRLRPVFVVVVVVGVFLFGCFVVFVFRSLN